MRAWYLERPAGIASLQLGEFSDPKPVADRLLVRIRSASVNPADINIVFGSRGSRFLHARRPPIMLGYDLSGTLEGVGSNTSGWREGDEVFGFLPYERHNDRGSFAELVAVTPGEITRKPSAVSHAEAACAATSAVTALQAIRLANDARESGRWLVIGASGGVGSFAVQLGRAAGAEVWGACSEGSMAFVRRLGASRVLDYRVTKLSQVAARFNLVLDAAARSSYRECERLLKTGGTYVAFRSSVRFITGVLSSSLSSRSCRLVRVRPDPADLDEIVRMIVSRSLKVPIDSSWSFTDLPGALRRFSDGHVRGKIAIAVG